jgi:hypothetical protein
MYTEETGDWHKQFGVTQEIFKRPWHWQGVGVTSSQGVGVTSSLATSLALHETVPMLYSPIEQATSPIGTHNIPACASVVITRFTLSLALLCTRYSVYKSNTIELLWPFCYATWFVEFVVASVASLPYHSEGVDEGDSSTDYPPPYFEGFKIVQNSNCSDLYDGRWLLPIDISSVTNKGRREITTQQQCQTNRTTRFKARWFL